MREVRRRPALVSVVALAGVFFGGAAIGAAQAAWLAPGSALADVVSFLHLPLAFVAGLSAWIGVAIITVVPKTIARLVRGEGRPRRDPARVMLVPPGSWVFLPLASVSGLLTGLVVGVLSSGAIGIVVPVYWATGTVYGAIVSALVYMGYLPFPDAA